MQETISRIRLMTLFFMPTREQWEELQKLLTLLFAFVTQMENNNRRYKAALNAIANLDHAEEPYVIARNALDGFGDGKS